MYNILWTGGLDSTCRLLELSMIENVTVQPYYIDDYMRKSTENEIKSMNANLEIIRNAKYCKADIKDIIIIKRKDLQRYEDIINAYYAQHGKHKYNCGFQYIYIAALCREYNINCELSMENEPRNHVRNALSKEAVLCECDDYLKIDNPINNPIHILFKDIHFPKSIWNMSKQDEINYIISIDKSILQNIWFCHTPINGQPCGNCHPCNDYKNYGVFNLFVNHY